ncbi:MAG: phosphotransferase [Rhodobacteraceae bacterium]|nr:phosphotransferase [Paracoccaceae bacterium]
MAEQDDRLAPEEVALLAGQMFGAEVDKVTAPGGRSRESLRVHFPKRTMVATQRSYPGRMRMEVEVLRRLSGRGAPVPRFLGGTEKVFFQADVGSRRLSGEMAAGKADQQAKVARRAVESLLEIHQAGRDAGLAEIVPGLGEREDWVKGFVGTAITSSEKFGIDVPDLDHSALVARLHVPAKVFIKWDARPGNAAVGKNDRVFWFDWEHCGKRHGMEDFAWMAGDEFWPLGAEAVLAPLAESLPEAGRDDNLDYLIHFITFHIVQRLTIIHRRHRKYGWVNADKAMRYDKIGTDPDLAIRLCDHGADWAARAALTRPMVAWFNACGAAIAAMPRE